MAYPYVKGWLFSGDPNEAMKAFDCGLKLSKLLAARGQRLNNLEMEILPTVNANPQCWLNSIETLTSHLCHEVQRAMGSDLQRLLIDKKPALLSLAEDLGKHDVRSNTLVHYDLQHANIILSESMATVIDLEDIYLASKKTALAYCAFKLSRHVVHKNPKLKSWVKGFLLPEMIAQLGPFEIKDKQDLFDFATIRTLNDISNILTMYYDEKIEFVLYDLRKKILNLFELAALTDKSECLSVD